MAVEQTSWDKSSQKTHGLKGRRFGERLKAHREAAKLTQKQLADKSGIPLATIQSWEINRRRPLAYMRDRVAKALGIRVPDLEG